MIHSSAINTLEEVFLNDGVLPDSVIRSTMEASGVNMALFPPRAADPSKLANAAVNRQRVVWLNNATFVAMYKSKKAAEIASKEEAKQVAEAKRAVAAQKKTEEAAKRTEKARKQAEKAEKAAQKAAEAAAPKPQSKRKTEAAIEAPKKVRTVHTELSFFDKKVSKKRLFSAGAEARSRRQSGRGQGAPGEIVREEGQPEVFGLIGWGGVCFLVTTQSQVHSLWEEE